MWVAYILILSLACKASAHMKWFISEYHLQGIATSGLPFIGNNHTYHEKLEARHRFISQPMVRDLSIINYTWCHKGVS